MASAMTMDNADDNSRQEHVPGRKDHGGGCAGSLALLLLAIVHSELYTYAHLGASASPRMTAPKPDSLKGRFKFHPSNSSNGHPCHALSCHPRPGRHRPISLTLRPRAPRSGSLRDLTLTPPLHRLLHQVVLWSMLPAGCWGHAAVPVILDDGSTGARINATEDPAMFLIVNHSLPKETQPTLLSPITTLKPPIFSLSADVLPNQERTATSIRAE